MEHLLSPLAFETRSRSSYEISRIKPDDPIQRVTREVSKITSVDMDDDFRVVLLNGPPGSGKDTVGRHISTLRSASCTTLKFAAPLKRSVYADYGIPATLPIDFFDPIKDRPCSAFLGKSFRQACIDKSERWMKQEHGLEVFGTLFLREVAFAQRDGYTSALVTDSGFADEAKPLLQRIGPTNVLLIRIHAEGRGKTFDGDSRSYITLPGVETIDVHNNEAEADFCDRMADLILPFLDA